MMLSERSWSTALAAATALLAIFPSTAEAASANEHAKRSKAAIQALNQGWYNTKSGLWGNLWWNSGNALTTIADFATLRVGDANDLNLGGFIRNTYNQAQKVNVQTSKSMSATGLTSTKYCINCGSSRRRSMVKKRGFDDFLNEYYDDEGWWALGLIRSFDATGNQDFLDSAVIIFNDMLTGRGSRCGGIYWSKERKYVNAIANELYLSVAASLANRIPSNTTYLEIAKSQWTWFDASGMINEKNLINDGLTSECKNNKLTTWSYNQGVILGGLAELAIATGNGEYLNRATIIANAAIDALSNPDGVLVEADKCELRSGHCGNDGQQFKGVFLRNLHYLYKLAPSDKFRTFILRNAESIWAKDRNNEDRLGVAWTGPYLDATSAAHSSALDALVAAIVVA